MQKDDSSIEKQSSRAEGGSILNPYMLFLKTLSIIAVCEFFVMVLLNALEITNSLFEFLADSLMLSALSAPFLYYWVINVVSRAIKTEAMMHQEARECELVNRALVEKVALKQYSEDIVKSVPSSIIVVSKDQRVLSANPSSCRILGKDAVPGKKISELIPVDGFEDEVAKVFDTGEAREGLTLELRDREKTKYLQANIAIIQSTEPGSETRALIVIDDITRRIEDERTIFTMAYYDPMTGLPNRLLLMDRVTMALSSARRSGEMAAVLFLDLDRFKFVNDTLGHEAGDELLKIVAGRLKQCLRITDTVSRSKPAGAEAPAVENTVARLGGDEFIVLLTGLPQDVNVINVANRILSCFDSPVNLKGHELFITTSIGISMFPFDGDSAEELLKKADMSMYWAKEEGRNNCKMYNTSLDSRRKDWLRLEYKLHKALELGEFILHYQPQVNTVTGEITGVECLIRWQDPETELIPPGRFIPIAEESGLIIPITSWVLLNACSQANSWRNKGHDGIRFSVNISMRQFKEKDFASTLTGILNATGLPPGCLEIELTESIIMTDTEHTVKILQELKKLGIRLSIDDFGTGFSSLSYLKTMPIDVIKIDRSFIRDIPSDADDIAITTAIINMAHSLGIEVIAEGVETMEQFELLRELGCDNIQGYLFMKPAGAQETEAFIEKWRPSGIMDFLRGARMSD
ncbi:putative signaling protein [uncultured bacterium]|nr:putative signaling protein [uncultured bacterium]